MKKHVYLDNAATTPMRPQVIEVVHKSMQQYYANSSSIYNLGRKSKAVLELARKQIALQIGVNASDVIFTSGGTEANNLILHSAVRDLKVVQIITSKIEHHAVLKTITQLQKAYNIKVSYVSLQANGDIDIENLKLLLQEASGKALVSLMHINNEIGTVLDLQKVAIICKEYQAYFHSDTVQSIGHYTLDFKKIGLDFIVASAHKFYGPKGIGFAVIPQNSGVKALQFGGEQERGLRAGTEAIHQIEGMSTALTIAYQNLKEEREYVEGVKNYAIHTLHNNIKGITFNAETTEAYRNYNLLSICLPIPSEKSNTILFQLDMQGIYCSRGSACQSGSAKPSHVLKEILPPNMLNKTSLRLSFSIYTTFSDIDYLVSNIQQIIK